MRAARLLPDRNTLAYCEVPEPTPQPGWALLEVKAAGLCHTDIHVMDGVQFAARNTVDYTVTRPRTLGHEVAGVVSAVGDRADEEWVGRAVAFGSGETTRATPGMHIDGGLARFCVVPVSNLVRVPDGVSLDTAAVATDSISTAYAAVHQAARVTAGDRIAVIGLGGLGLNAVRISSLVGATVFGVDIDAGRFDLARKAGAETCVGHIGELADQRVSAVLDFVGGETTGAASRRSRWPDAWCSSAWRQAA
jgi:propanol-preferring alcohol dehydrogenase